MKTNMLSMSYSIANRSDLSELKDFQMSNRQEMSNKSASGPHRMNLSSQNEVRSQRTDDSRIALVVLGMHRSGTSMLTNLLFHSGFSLPKTLINATKENQKGHFESFPVVRLNEKMMREEFESHQLRLDRRAAYSEVSSLKLPGLGPAAVTVRVS